MAKATGMPEYGLLMSKAASHLEERAATLESPDSARFLPVRVEPNVQWLTRDFADVVASSSAR